LLFNVGAMQESKRADLSDERTAENLDAVRNDCDGSPVLNRDVVKTGMGISSSRVAENDVDGLS